MSLELRGKANENTYEIIPQGLQSGVCISVIDAGNYPNPFKNNALCKKVVLFFELDKYFTQGEKAGEPMIIHKEYTFSVHENSALIRDLERWRGKRFNYKFENGEKILYSDNACTKVFNLENLIGANCTLSIEHKISKKGNNFAVVSSINSAVDTYKKNPLKPKNPSTFCPDWLAKRISEESVKDIPEPAIQTNDNSFNTEEDDDVPF